MSSWTPGKSPDAYPQIYHTAILKAFNDPESGIHETEIGWVETLKELKTFQNKFSSFKSGLKHFPLHAMHGPASRVEHQVRGIPVIEGGFRVVVFARKRVGLEGVKEALSKTLGKRFERNGITFIKNT